MTTATELKKLPTTPPQPTAMSIRAHGKTLALKIDAMKLGAGQLVLDLARGKNGAQEALTDLYLKLKTLEFALEMNDRAVELARQEDQAAEAAYRAAIQELPAEEIISGLTKDSCGSFCVPGGPGGCVISAPAARSGGVCVHPVTERHLWFKNEEGRVNYPYSDNARSHQLFLTACKKLKVSPV
jgi:hypothetical protein